MSLHHIGGPATRILCLVATECGCSPAELKGPQRMKHISHAREEAYWQATKHIWIERLAVFACGRRVKTLQVAA